MDDGYDFMLSQVLDTVETEIMVENSLGNLTISQSIEQYLGDEDPTHMDFETINFDLGIFLPGNSLEKMDGDIKEETLECVKDSQDRRFAAAVSDDDLQKLINSQANPNTRRNTKWSVELFNKWRASRENVPCMKEMNAEMLNYWLQRFVLEVRKQDGSEYPPRTLYYIACGLLRHLRDENIHDMNFLDEHDHRFAVFRRVLDARMKELLSKGLGTKLRQADPILPDDEKIWAQGVFGSHSSQAVQYTVFFYNCKIFGLRAYDEHRNLECSQFEIGQDDRGKFVRFTGRSSKTYKGGLKHLQCTNKDLKHYCQEGKIHVPLLIYYSFKCRFSLYFFFV